MHLHVSSQLWDDRPALLEFVRLEIVSDLEDIGYQFEAGSRVNIIPKDASEFASDPGGCNLSVVFRCVKNGPAVPPAEYEITFPLGDTTPHF